MGKRMLFFVNPNAGHSDIRARLLDVVEIFTRGGYEVTVHPTTRAGDLTDTVAAEGACYDLVAAVGGDGTLHEAVAGLMQLDAPPPLGYLPGGTVNDVAATLHLSKDLLEAARTVVTGQEARIDLGCFNERWFAYAAAFGAFTGVPYETKRDDKRLLGRLAYLLRGVQALGEIHPIHVRVRSGAQEIDDEAIFGLVCNTTSVGGFKIRPGLEVALNDGLSEVLLVREVKSLADMNAVAGALLQQDFSGESFHFFHAERVSFDFDEEVPWTLDGEFGGAVRHAEIQNHRQVLRILVPEAEMDAGGQ